MSIKCLKKSLGAWLGTWKNNWFYGKYETQMRQKLKRRRKTVGVLLHSLRCDVSFTYSGTVSDVSRKKDLERNCSLYWSLAEEWSRPFLFVWSTILDISFVLRDVKYINISAISVIEIFSNVSHIFQSTFSSIILK